MGFRAAKHPNQLSTVRSRGEELKGAFIYVDDNGKKRDVMLYDVLDVAIFGLDNREIYDQFRDLINTEKYQFLRKYKTKEGVGECWFHDRIDLMRTFWKELQSKLCELNGQKS